MKRVWSKLQELYETAVIRGRVTGIITTVVGMAVLQLMSQFGRVPITAALSFVVIVLATDRGGLWVGLGSVILVSIYNQYNFPVSPTQALILFGLAIAVALTVGYLKRQARIVDNLNGNLLRLKTALEITRELKLSWADLSDHGRYKRVEQIEDILGNLAALVFGWLSIRKDMEDARRQAEEIRSGKHTTHAWEEETDSDGTTVTRYRVEKDKEQPMDAPDWKPFEDAERGEQ